MGIAILLLGLSAAAIAQEPLSNQTQDQPQVTAFTIDGARNTEALSPYIDYLLDSSWALTLEDMRGDRAKEFKRIPTLEPDFGYIDSRIWLRLRVKNISAGTTDWRVYVRENFLQYYDVYVVRESGAVEHIESHNPDTVFSERSTDYPELVSPFKFDVSESVTIFIAYWSGGSSHAAVSIETAQSFSDIAVTRTSKNYLSYGIMMILILVATLALIILRREVFLAYLSYVATTLIYLAHIDGVTFQLLWPNAPHFNSYFTIVIGTIFVIATYYFARIFLQTRKYHPRMDSLFVFLAVLAPVITIPGAFLDPQFTKRFIFVLIFLAIVLGTIVGLIAATTRFRQVRFYLIAWICGIGTAGLMNLRHNFGFEITQDTEFDAIRLSIIVDAALMGLGVADRYRQIQHERHKAAEENLKTAERNLRLNKRLFDLEEQYKLASELVTSRDAQMRDTVHDLRTPLHALRLSVQKMEKGNALSTEDKTQIDGTFSYLEELMASHLQDTVLPMGANVLPLPQRLSENELALPDILGSIHEMFLPDAQEKGLDFRYVPSRAQLSAELLVLMRVVSNLVSNAIKYTPSGRVLLGVRRKPDGLSLEVHDTGIGMSRAEFEFAKGRNVRLESGHQEAKGSGHGLAIASGFAAKQGWELRYLGGRSTGTSLSLFIPHAKN